MLPIGYGYWVLGERYELDVYYYVYHILVLSITCNSNTSKIDLEISLSMTSIWKI